MLSMSSISESSIPGVWGKLEIFILQAYDMLNLGLVTVHFLLLAKIHKSPTWTGPGGKLSYRSAINQKVRLFAGSVCPWPQGQAEVGRDQEHPGNTSHGPNKLKFGQTYYFYISKNRA